MNNLPKLYFTMESFLFPMMEAALRNQIFVLLHSLVQIFSFRNPGTAGLGVAFLHFLPLLHGGILAASALYLILIVTRV